MIGKTLNHFKVLDRLGKGGMSEVYLAEDSRLKRRVALPGEVARESAAKPAGAAHGSTARAGRATA